MICPSCQNSVTEGELFCGNCGSPLTAPPEDSFPSTATIEEVSSERDPLLGQTLDAKYQLLQRLGEGGMGAVYRARRQHIGDEVAVKVLMAKYVAGEKATERFRREARAAAMLRHPNVVTIHDFSDGSKSDDPAYIVMELVEGVSLRALLRQEGRISAERAVSLMHDICSGVSVAHRRGVIHRDLKPDNIIIRLPESAREKETVKVIDFGIAKLREADAASTLTQTGTVMGTPFYMSPEQCLGEDLDARSDVYSLGTILYEMLGGAPPFTGGTPTAIAMKHLTDVPVPLEQRGVAPALARVCQRALEKNRDDRHQSVDALYADLSEALASAGETLPISSISSVDTAPTVSKQFSRPFQAAVDAPGLAPTVAIQGSTQPTNLIQPPAAASRQLKRARNFAIAGGLLVFVLSIGMGFLLRWVGWAGVKLSYDEFALALITDAFRDAIFGVLLGIALSGIRRSANAVAEDWKSRIARLIIYAAFGGALAMAPFVILRTSLFLLPLGIAVLGMVLGLIVCGVRMLVQTFASTK